MGHMVMGQELNGSLGSWVTQSDPFPALPAIYNFVRKCFDVSNAFVYCGVQ